MGNKTNAEFQGKKLLILGGNPETIPLVETANEMGIKTIVSSARKTDAAKKTAWKSYDIDGMNVDELVAMARREKVDGVLVGVADILVPAYCKVCEILELPCYATQKIVDVFSFKDRFKSTCERYGIYGIPEYHLDASMDPQDLAKIKYPVMVKPVDNGGGVGMTVCRSEAELKPAVDKALAESKQKRFIVERYMQCDDVAMYYTFVDGKVFLSSIDDRFTTSEQPGFSRVCLGSVYPSKYIDIYFDDLHEKFCRMFTEIGIKYGVLMISAFCENGVFYVYDPGFRLQGEAPHLLIASINGFDHREMLIQFALAGSTRQDISGLNDPYFKGKFAGTIWYLLKPGRITSIAGVEKLRADPAVVDLVQRLYDGDNVDKSWVGTERQVLLRAYVVCSDKDEYKDAVHRLQGMIKVKNQAGEDMLLKGFSAEKAWA